MSIGTILLLIVAVLLLFGVGQRVLDRLYLTDRQAIVVILAMIAGGLLPDIPLGGGVSVNIGGALIPFGLCVYLFVRAGTAKERVRAIAASVATGVAVYWMGMLLPNEPESMWFDTNYLYGIAAGVFGYIFGRSRRGAFMAGVLGMLGSDITSAIVLRYEGVSQTLALGGAGVADAVVISGFVAVLFAELVGELIERASRGVDKRARTFENGKIVRKGEKV